MLTPIQKGRDKIHGPRPPPFPKSPFLAPCPLQRRSPASDSSTWLQELVAFMPNTGVSLIVVAMLLEPVSSSLDEFRVLSEVSVSICLAGPRLAARPHEARLVSTPTSRPLSPGLDEPELNLERHSIASSNDNFNSSDQTIWNTVQTITTTAAGEGQEPSRSHAETARSRRCAPRATLQRGALVRPVCRTMPVASSFTPCAISERHPLRSSNQSCLPSK